MGSRSPSSCASERSRRPASASIPDGMPGGRPRRVGGEPSGGWRSSSSPTARPARSALRVVYIDSSALLKLLWQEPESDAVRDHVASEDLVIVSSLAELETHVQVTAAWLAGPYGKGRPGRLPAKAAGVPATAPVL